MEAGGGGGGFPEEARREPRENRDITGLQNERTYMTSLSS